MNTSNREKAIFCEALELPHAARGDFVRRACGDDAELRRRIEKLLERARQVDGVDSPASDGVDSKKDHLFQKGWQAGCEPGPAPVPPPAPEDAGTGCPEDGGAGRSMGRPASPIGPYRLLEPIGEGGFGMVFVAEQERPVRRQVALKVIKLGMESREVIARFEAERQALAMMDHPHIAKVLDAGATETGRPYFVMELVRGDPITRYCDEHRLTIRQRVELFLPVCQAIQHAHQKGIVHRDIKPSNVLIARGDGTPHPMVIDFGIAKAIGQRLTERTIHTGPAQMIGTPAYMSPEQAGMGQDVDTRSDVYSLGILLYELLAGAPPFPEERLRELDLLEIQRIITQEEPARPSTTFSRPGTRSLVVFENRRANRAMLGRMIAGDLDWIVLKAIEKDRNRRYPTANGLAADLQRHLAQEPVTASPPDTYYRVAKFVRRHRAGVGAALAVFLTLAAGVVAASLQAARALKAERMAERRQRDTEALAADVIREKSDRDAVNTWLLDDLLQLANPTGSREVSTPRGAELKLKDALILAAGSLSERFAKQPLIEAELRARIGGALAEMGIVGDGVRDLRRSIALYREHLGREHHQTLMAEFQLGVCLARYYPIHSRNERERELGLEGERLMERCHASRQSLPAGSTTGMEWALSMAEHYLWKDDVPRASALIVPVFAEVEQVLKESPARAWDLRRRSLRCLQWLRDKQGRMSEAYALARQHAAWVEQDAAAHPGRPGDVHTALADRVLAVYRWRFDDDHDAAERLLLRALQVARPLEGDSRRTQWILEILSVLYRDMGRYGDAASYMRGVLDSVAAILGPSHSDTQGVGWTVASAYGRSADWDGVMAEYRTQREKGIVSVNAFAESLLAGELAGAGGDMAELRAALWKRFEEDPAGSGVTLVAALTMLVIPGWESESDRVRRLAEATLAQPPDSPRDGARRELLRGLLDLRIRGSRAGLDHLVPLAESSTDRRVGTVALFHAAMAFQDLGDHAAAVRSFEAGVSRLGKFLAVGDLDPGEFDIARLMRWTIVAQALVARDEAERRVMGRRISAPVNPAWLTAARERWMPVKQQLTRMDQAARGHDLAAARRLLDEVRRQPDLDWETASVALDGIAESALAVLAASVDEKGYADLVVELFPGASGLPSPYLLLAGMARTELPAPVEKAIQLTLQTELSRTDSENRGNRSWRALRLGVALYRERKFPEAARQLQAARGSTEHDCFLLATTYAALAAKHLGQNEEAGRWHREAKEAVALRREAAREKLDPKWWFVVFAERALRDF